MCVKKTGKRAVTHVKLLHHEGDRSVLRLRLETGRTHQIRVHLAEFGMPVKGDSIYAHGEWSEGPLQLHAAWLSFDHPLSKKRVCVYAEPWPDFNMGKVVTRERVSS